MTRTDTRDSRPRIYAAHPIASYGTRHETTCRCQLGLLFPGVDVFDPSGRYGTHDGWRRAWPRVLASLSGLVVFPAEDGTIGTGCLRELTDAITWRLPIAGLADGALHEIEGVELLPMPRRSARFAGRLLLAGQIEPDAFVPSWAARRG
jgi:hypothetical protein